MDRKGTTMATWRPDPTYILSFPRMAIKAQAETLAYVASFDPTRLVPDAIIGVVEDGIPRRSADPAGKNRTVAMPDAATD